MAFRPFLFLAAVAAIALAGCSSQSGSSTPSNELPKTTKRIAATGVTQLGSYNINPSKVFVAGISSGGFEAVQLDVAFSKTFKGAAIYAGGVYYCAQDSETNALVDCGGADSYNSELTPSENYLNQQSTAGTIDPSSNLSGQKVYLWSGTADTEVPQKSMNDLQTEYQHYGASVTYDNSFDAEHGWESPDGTVACATLSSPYMIKCDQGSSVYDSEKTWLTMFFGTLNARNGGTLGGSLINFDQTQFSTASGLDTNGYVFVPQSCAGGTQCGLVVALDGCEQYQGAIGNEFVTEAGIDEWADTNNIVVLYPYQTTVSGSNPNGCWDWWGYGSANYALKSGPQMAAIYTMIQRVMGGTVSPSPSPTTSPTTSPTSSPTTSPTATPTATPTLSPTPSPTPTATATPLACWTATNYAQVQAGRAYQSIGYAYANGSNQNMGLDNVYYTTSLEETGSNYYVIVPHC
jgi:poly(3-hydroxybutyrate) depolymerase